VRTQFHFCEGPPVQHVVCEGCGEQLPLAETARVKGRCLCLRCTKGAIEAKDAAPADVVRNVDLTVCFKCGKDGGEREFEVVEDLGLGACPECRVKVVNVTFPPWVLATLGAMLFLALAAGIYNWRFVEAYMDIRGCRAAGAQSDFTRAAILAEMAARNVPEDAELGALSHYYKGLDHFSQGRDSQAHAEFVVCCQMVPSEEAFAALRDRAAPGKAFDEKNYDEFLRLTLAYASQPDAKGAAGMLASAYACKYAETRQEQYKAKAMENLAKTKEESAADDPEGYAKFEDRMLHRMDTGEIIGSKEFEQLYPNGYKAGKEGKP
jgi:hypothetical protein